MGDALPKVVEDLRNRFNHMHIDMQEFYLLHGIWSPPSPSPEDNVPEVLVKLADSIGVIWGNSIVFAVAAFFLGLPFGYNTVAWVGLIWLFGSVIFMIILLLISRILSLFLELSGIWRE